MKVHFRPKAASTIRFIRTFDQTMWTTTQLKRELMEYWKLLTEGPLHTSEEAAAADLRNDSKSRLLRCEIAPSLRNTASASAAVRIRLLRPCALLKNTTRQDISIWLTCCASTTRFHRVACFVTLQIFVHSTCDFALKCALLNVLDSAGHKCTFLPSAAPLRPSVHPFVHVRFPCNHQSHDAGVL